MINHTPYRIITYILLPIVGFLSLMLLFLLLAALANPAMFLGVFLFGGVVVYYFTAFHFFHKAVLKAKPLKPSLKDWIKVNAYVGVAFAAWTIFNSFWALTNPPKLKEAVHEVMVMQKAQLANVSEAFMLQFVQGFLYCIIAAFALLLVHIFLTFRLLKQYKHVFDKA
jgi:hypothetical protein